MEEKYAIIYYKFNGSPMYRIRIQNTKTYEYVKELEVSTNDINSVLDTLRSEYTPSYTCEVKY